MDRRGFLAKGLPAAGAALAASTLAARSAGAAQPKRKFKLKYAPHPGMFRQSAGDDTIDQMKFMADQGFTAMEYNRVNRQPKEVQENIGRTLRQLGMTMGVFVAHSDFEKPSFASGRKEDQERVLKDVRDSVEVAKRVGAKWCTIVPGTYLSYNKGRDEERGYQTANVIELLRRCAALCEPSGLVMVLEPLNPWSNHPGLFLTKIPQAYMICKAVDSPSCKILDDLYHQQISEGNLIPNLDRAWDEIAYIQVGDNPGRFEPTTGEINYKNIFRHIYKKGYKGIVGMEHSNSKPGKAGEQAVIDAYIECDSFNV